MTWVGVDDTDSLTEMCTTYLATEVIRRAPLANQADIDKTVAAAGKTSNRLLRLRKVPLQPFGMTLRSFE